MLISVLSAKGSPGVTTMTLALASCWTGRAVVVDADPLCGDMLAGVCAGRVPATTGLVELMVAARQVGVAAALPGQLIRPAKHCAPIVAGLGAPGQAAGIAWPQLAAGLAELGWADVLADCGRYGTAPTPVAMLARSELVVLVLGSSLRAVRAAARTVAVVREDLTRAGCHRDHLVAVVVDPGRPYEPGEIASALGVAVIGALPHDPAAAAVWSDGHARPRGFDRSSLQRANAGLAAQLMTLIQRSHGWTTRQPQDRRGAPDAHADSLRSELPRRLTAVPAALSSPIVPTGAGNQSARGRN